MSVYVFGHRNPDTDAICSALAYADLLRRTTRPDAVAACCGPLNQRTEFALRRAGIDPPKLIVDVRPEVGDFCRRSPIVANEDEVFSEVYQRMKQFHISAMPVLSSQGRFVGLLTLLDLMNLIFEGDSDPLAARRVSTCIHKINEVLGGSLQHAVSPEAIDNLMIMVGAMSAERFTERLHQFPAEQLLVVSGDRPTIQLPALEHGVRVLVVTGGYQLSSGLMQLARLNNVTVISSPHDTATTTMRIKSSRRIAPAVQAVCMTLNPQMPITEARSWVARSRQKLFPVLDDAGMLYGVLSKSDLVNPPKRQLVLVDHNELSQAVQGAEESEIVEVLDHHRLGGVLRSDQPIRFVNEPVGSTCTLVARQFYQASVEPEPGIALCMVAGIISDTLHLRSPTTTAVDSDMLKWLTEFCTVEVEDFIQEFFEVGSALRTHSAHQVIMEDCKEFEDRGQRFSISQIEETGFELFWDRREELVSALADLANRRRLDFAGLLVTDIVTNGSLFLMSPEPEFCREMGYPKLEPGLFKMDGFVSRKKQLLPLITKLIKSTPQISSV